MPTIQVVVTFYDGKDMKFWKVSFLQFHDGYLTIIERGNEFKYATNDVKLVEILN